VINHRGKVIVATFILLCFLEGRSHALNDQLVLSQSSSGEVIVELDGLLAPCNTVRLGNSTVSQTGSAFFVSTMASPEPLPCPTPPPQPQPTLYKLTVTLGSLPDGDYSVSWS
jgi:hypothetical protein